MPERAPSRQALTGRRVLVTGAAGFLGSHLVPRLVSERAIVIGVSRRPQSDENGIQWRRSDLADVAEVEALVRDVRPDVVFHLAGLVTAIPERELVVAAFQSLLGSTVNLLQAATTAGCGRVVLVGSLLEPTAEDPNFVPGSPYVAAKVAATTYARMFHALYGTPVMTARLAHAYGPKQDQSKVIPYVIRSLLREEVPQLGGGAYRADWLYIDDAIDGLVAAATVAGVEGAALDIGSGELTSVRDLVHRIVQRSRSPLLPAFGARPDRPLEWCRSADVATTQTRLAWSPRVSLDAGIDRTVAWWREQLAASRVAATSA